MSGHSKWATIKRAKGAADVKRGLAFTKLSNAITIAVKQGGGIGDPAQNFKLRLAVEAARALNMPKENIERAIGRAAAKGEKIAEEVTYEGFASEGVAIIVEAATDNPQRTSAEIKNIFNKSNASFGQPGSVSYLFKQVGKIVVVKDGKTFDDIFALAVESGANDIEEGVEDRCTMYTDTTSLFKVKDALVAKGLKVEDVGLVRKPINVIPIADAAKKQQIFDFIGKLEEMDDVQKVYSNISLN
ncbi:MAG: YebC/PmpR family DNA-binding transcriptional regulator [Candidatus Levybacteria bacterium]|nr:YebC/PmpR family DNA-binding transcriptional regulator [Candidatus Levybacteria bacterium]